MKSILFRKYGTSKNLEIKEVGIPTCNSKEVLVKIHAASVNDWDWCLLRGKPFINRLLFGLFKPKIKTLGIDISGIVEFVGPNTSKFKISDEVFGDLSGANWGGFAEYVCVNEKCLEIKPPKMTFAEAAAIPQAGVLAIQGFIDEWTVEGGQQVLINGAGGGSGTFAIQIAKTYGAVVTGVDKAMKFETMRNVGADIVIDYEKDDFTKNGLKYDYILDFAGYNPLLAYKRSLTVNGKYLLVGGSSSLIIKCILLGPLISLVSKKKMKILAHQPNKYLSKIIELFDEGKLNPILDSTYPLDKVPDALKYFGNGKVKGKIVILIENS